MLFIAVSGSGSRKLTPLVSLVLIIGVVGLSCFSYPLKHGRSTRLRFHRNTMQNLNDHQTPSNHVETTNISETNVKRLETVQRKKQQTRSKISSRSLKPMKSLYKKLFWSKKHHVLLGQANPKLLWSFAHLWCLLAHSGQKPKVSIRV